MRSVRTRSVLGTVMAAVLLVGTAACGSDEPGDATAPTSDATAPTSAEDPAAEGPGVEAVDDTEATEIGVTADSIRITVIADVDNVPAPGLFRGSVDGVEGFAEYVNSQGGIAGRRLEVQFIDSKLSPDEARSAVLQACQDSFALVGTSALFLSSLDAIADCEDITGAATGIPDLSVVQTTFQHACSPTSFGVNGTAIDCETLDQPTQRYRVSAAPARYFEENHDVTRGSWIHGSDVKGALDGTLPVAAGEQTIIEGENFLVSAIAPQSVYTPYVQSLRRDGVDYVYQSGIGRMQIAALQEAMIQGADVDVWTCTVACYDRSYLEEGGAVVEGTYVTLAQLPFEEADTNEQLAAMVSSVEDLDGFGSIAWISGLLFQEAAERVVEEEGVNGLTRANLLEALRGIDDFDAGGLIGPTDIAAHRSSGCLVVLRVEDGAFARVHPEEPGTLDCDPENLVTVELDVS